ncbi:hypothetical protein [Saccharopolyspora phatthalungensis]|uniref:hypothetical protein n=1 Tax=Saccharopolyspora phatthalungensis TaxID=664693 RepID=UPI0028AFDCCF|nr:hypothetical protein [Saccharopolyspora phatthalungensis]
MLRWIIVLLLVWAGTAIYFLVSTEVTIAGRIFGKGEATAEPTARVELERGQPFGLAAHRDEYAKCEVIPEAGEARVLIPDRPANSLRSTRLPEPVPAWFSGAAEVHCAGPATVLLPERYEKTGLNVLMGLMTASGLMIVVVLVQIGRRVRVNTRLYAGA